MINIIIQYETLPRGILFKILKTHQRNSRMYFYVHGCNGPNVKYYVWARDNCLEEGDFILRDVES